MWAKHALILLLFYLLQGFIFLVGMQGWVAIQAGGLLQWDAELYADIVRDGYSRMYTAFFPLFPLVWKLTGLGAIGISLLNGFLFIVSLSWLSSELKAKTHELLLLAATPTFIFFLVPYSEALFFLGSTLLLAGLFKKQQSLLLIGLLVCSFARPTASVFIPAIVITEWLCRDSPKKALLQMLKQIVAAALGLFLALWVHQNYTGAWLSFFDVQSEYWDNTLRIPSLPLRSWAGMKITMLDGFALSVSMMSGIALFKSLQPNFKRLKSNAPKGLVFSLLYLLGIGLVVLLFRGGELFSLNRFVFASAFFVVAAFYFAKLKLSKKAFYFPLALFLYWLLFNSYVHIQTLLKYLLVTLFLSLPVVMQIEMKNKWISRLAAAILFAGLAAIQLYFFSRHLGGQWVA